MHWCKVIYVSKQSMGVTEPIITKHVHALQVLVKASTQNLFKIRQSFCHWY
jgi:hypothetical protein